MIVAALIGIGIAVSVAWLAWPPPEDDHHDIW